jgi:hypothetical protein
MLFNMFFFALFASLRLCVFASFAFKEVRLYKGLA